MSKFKIGDKVRVLSVNKTNTPEPMMDKFINSIQIVESEWHSGCMLKNVTAGNHQWIFHDDLLELVESESASTLDVQFGGDHYKKLGQYQPWEVLKAWLTEDEFRGYMKGTAIAYLARERDKGGVMDIEKATHTLQGLLELIGEKND